MSNAQVFHYPQAASQPPSTARQHSPPAHPLWPLPGPWQGAAYKSLVGVQASLPSVLPRQWALPGVRLNFPTLLVLRTKHLIPPPRPGPPRLPPWQHEDPWGASQTHQAGQGGAEDRKVIHPICRPTFSRLSTEGRQYSQMEWLGGGNCR